MKKRSNTNAASAIGFVTMLTITFVIMKLAGGISWSWGWVLAPVWISAIFVGLILLITLTVIIVKAVNEATKEGRK